MKMIEDLRVENMGLLRDQFGSVTALAARLQRSDSQVSQWINASINSATGQPRGMKPKTARWIEETVGKPKGWLDQDHSARPSHTSSDETTTFEQPAPKTTEQMIKELAARVVDEGIDTAEWAPGQFKFEISKLLNQSKANPPDKPQTPRQPAAKKVSR